ncbi:hypothetical protein VHUM_02823 [Vanrija humicola]|uniref:NADP-dependent oxidoreductase domain-containing protein n=1 Tax=Vanrija humicola TaxID=5417 RepID=A0A7D8UYJ5_VANHU|nr:hypothetical protein VHUM_02823 [Vanrija humicola]
MSLGRTIKLNNGVSIPQIGFGTWQSAPGEVGRAAEEALKAGYKHIDAAYVYNNQPELAAGIKASGVPRSDIFITSKLWNTAHRVADVEKNIDETLKQLDTDYLDLLLIHWPVAFAPGDALLPLNEDKTEVVIDLEAPGIAATWAELVRIQKETKKLRAIGVSNFTIEQIETIVKATGVTPAVNQVEAHPQAYNPDLWNYAAEKGIAITAYSPLGNNVGGTRALNAPEIKAIADKLGKTPAQVLIAWGAAKGFVVIPKSVTKERIASNFETFDLPKEDVEAITAWGAANRNHGAVPATFKPKWPINIFNYPEEQGEKPVW